jgi:predicted Zn-dependent peptidase
MNFIKQMKKKKITILSLVALLTIPTFAQIDRSVRPTAGPAPEIKIGESQSFTLDNGLQVFVVENHKLPRVAISLSFDIKPFSEGDKIGYSNIAGDLLATGTNAMDKEQFNQSVDFIGANFSTSANSLYMSGLSKYNEQLINMLADVAMNANFTQEELDKLKKQYISGLASEKDDPDAIANNVRKALVYGKNHPYGELPSEESIENITLEDAKSYYETYFKPNIAYMAIVGDVNFKKVKKLITRNFDNWQKGEIPTFEYETPTAPEMSQIVFVNKPGAVQSVINVCYPVDLKPADADKIPASVMNTLFGGGFTSRLNLNLREENSFTYGARSTLSDDQLVGYFNATAKVRNEVTDSALMETLKEMVKMQEGVTTEELQGIKNYITGNFAIGLENPQTVARFEINKQINNLPADYYANYLKNVAAVSQDDIKAMAEKYIRPMNAYILVVGNKDEVAGDLEKLSPTGQIRFVDNRGNEVVETLKPAPAGMTAQTVIDNYITAIGGMENMKKVKNIKSVMSAEMMGRAISVEVTAATPNKYLLEMKMGEMVVQKQVFDGVKGKESGMQGARDLEGDDLASLALEAQIFPELNYQKENFTLELKGVDKVNGEEVYVVDITNPLGNKTTNFYSTTSGLLIQSETTEETPQGAFVATKTLSDYTEVKGVKFPYMIKQSFGPQTFDMKMESMEVNTKLPNGTFAVE